jgi:hypothetical protein
MLQVFKKPDPQRFEIRIYAHERELLVYLTVNKIILEGESLIFYNDEDLLLISPSRSTKVSSKFNR